MVIEVSALKRARDFLVKREMALEARVAELQADVCPRHAEGYHSRACKGGGRESGDSLQVPNADPREPEGRSAAADPAAHHACYDCDCDCVDVGRAHRAARARTRGTAASTARSTHSKRVERPP